MLKYLIINFFLLKLNQWLKIFCVIVFTYRLFNSSIFVSVGTLMDEIQKNNDDIRYFNEIFLNLSVFTCKRLAIANILMYNQIITHFFVTIIRFYEKLISF